MKFPCTLKNTLLIIRDRFGLPSPQKDWATLLHFIYRYRYLLVTNYFAINLPITDNFNASRNYLAENHLSFPSAPHWVRHSYLLKEATTIPYTCGLSWTPLLIHEKGAVTGMPSPMIKKIKANRNN